MPDWGYFLLIIHQIFSLARDWSNHITWPNIPQLRFQKTVCFSEQIMFVDKYPSKRNKRRLFSIYVLVSHGKSLPPDPSPKFPQFIPTPVFPNLLTQPPPPLLLTTTKFFWVPKKVAWAPKFLSSYTLYIHVGEFNNLILSLVSLYFQTTWCNPNFCAKFIKQTDLEVEFCIPSCVW